jgi:hypothetical protein
MRVFSNFKQGLSFGKDLEKKIQILFKKLEKTRIFYRQTSEKRN